jgi:hypothetical protein
MAVRSRLPLPTLLAGVLLSSHVVFLLLESYCNFVVIDEYGHLAAGVSHWTTGTFHAYRVNPPLPRLLATLPVHLGGAIPMVARVNDAVDHRPEWELADEFSHKNAAHYLTWLRMARLAGIFWSLLGAVIVFCWCRELFGPWAACVSMSLWCFDPTIIAVGGTILPDIPSAAAGVAASYAWWRYLRVPSMERAWYAGLLLGVALLTKVTLVLLVGIWPLLWLYKRLSAAGGVRWTHLFMAELLSLLVLNLGYAFEGSFSSLRSYDFISTALAGELEPGEVSGNRFRESWLGWAPVPLPANYLRGIDFLKKEFETGYLSYLHGEWSERGWWYYYLYAMLVKLPLGSLLLMAAGTIVLIVRRPQGMTVLDGLCLLLPAFAVLVLVSSQTGFTHHFRYVLPALPFLFIAAGATVAAAGRSTSRGWSALILILTAWVLLQPIRVCPHFYAYFNEAAGGPENGDAHLISSNFDWGQGLLALKAWLDAQEIHGSVRLAAFHCADPRLAGIDYTLPSLDPEAGLLIVSASLVRGAPYHVCDGTGARRFLPCQAFAWCQHFRPIAKVGYSLFVYQLSPEEIAAYREQRRGSQVMPRAPMTH